MSLTDWLNEGKIQQHTASREEISRLLAVFERDIKDARTENLSADRRFTTAYNAALMIARAAMAAAGYRTTGEANHYITIHSLPFTMKPDPKTVILLNKYRQKRNKADYELIGLVSEQDVSGIIALAQSLRELFIGWLKENHPSLIE